MRPLFALAILAIIHFSLFPWRWDPALYAKRPFVWLGIGSNSDLTDIALNLFFYLIPALIGQWALSTPKTQRRSLFHVVAGLTVLSFILETLQLGIPGRYANLRDIFCNAVGALAGASLACFLPNPSRFLTRFRLPPQAVILALFFLAWLSWQAFPFLPHVRLHRILQIPHLLLNPTWRYTELADVFFALLLLHLIALHLRLPAFRFTLAAAALLPFQSFVRNSEISPNRLAAAALALLLAATLFRRPNRHRTFYLAVLLTAWLLIRQISPGGFTAEAVNSFTWTPFVTLIEYSRVESVRLLSAKILLYGGAIWLWRETGLTLRLATLAVFLLLTLTEIFQCFIPGRTPETTDLVLTLLSAWLIHKTTNGGYTKVHPPPNSSSISS